jgi:hypothetical protein
VPHLRDTSNWVKAIFQRVLCADYNSYFRHFVAWFLTDVGCEVATVAMASGGAVVELRPEPPTQSHTAAS